MISAPPVRYAVGQPDFDPEIGRRLRVFVDAVEQKQVVEYDCQEGTVLRNKLDDQGNAQLNEAKDEVLRETLTGNVTVDWEA